MENAFSYLIILPLILMVIGILLWLAIRKQKDSSGGSSPKAPFEVSAKNTKAEKTLSKSADLLVKRWERAFESASTIESNEFPNWFLDEPSDRQLEYLSNLGIRVNGGITKGQVSDLIGLFHSADDEDIEVLKFFKQSTQGTNQTSARILASQLLSDPHNQVQWKTRPPTQIQKEFYRFFELTMPSDLTLQDAESEILRKLSEFDDSAGDEWDGFADCWEDLSDSEVRRDAGIKKVSMKIFREYCSAKRESGESLKDLDVYDVIEDLLERHSTLALMK